MSSSTDGLIVGSAFDADGALTVGLRTPEGDALTAKLAVEDVQQLVAHLTAVLATQSKPTLH